MPEISADEDCYCGRRAITRTSWTAENPGRRFNICLRSRRGGCRYFSWVDPPMCERARVIIPGLLRKLRGSDEEILALRKRQKNVFKWLILSWVLTLCLLFSKFTHAPDLKKTGA